MNSSFKFALGFLALVLLLLCVPKVGYAAPPQPCSLLTQAQVSKTLGTAVLAGKPNGQFDCEWDQVGWTMAKGERVLLHVLGPVGNETPAQRFNTIKMPLPFGRMTKTPGPRAHRQEGRDCVSGRHSRVPTRPSQPNRGQRKGAGVGRFDEIVRFPVATRWSTKPCKEDEECKKQWQWE